MGNGVFKDDQAGSQGGPMQKVVRACNSAVAHLLPKDHHSSVRGRYLNYVGFYTVASVAGSMSMVFSTQSMLFAAGLSTGAIPVAAALSWVLKDGIGQLGGVLFASVINTSFDADPKRWRFIAGAVLDVAAVIEGMIPFAPHLFLPLASLSNILKNISFLAASASRASLHASFARKGNLADVTAKSGAQTTVAATIGTAAAAAISMWADGDCTIILGCVLATTLVHISALTFAIRCAPVDTLNLQRFELLAQHFLDHNTISTPEELCEVDTFLGTKRSPFSHVLYGYKGVVKLDATLEDLVKQGACMKSAARDIKQQGYFLLNTEKVVPERERVWLVLGEGVSGRAVFEAVFKAMQIANGTDASEAGGEPFESFLELLTEATWNVQHSLIESDVVRVKLE